LLDLVTLQQMRMHFTWVKRCQPFGEFCIINECFWIQNHDNWKGCWKECMGYQCMSLQSMEWQYYHLPCVVIISMSVWYSCKEKTISKWHLSSYHSNLYFRITGFIYIYNLFLVFHKFGYIRQCRSHQLL
jgi:hypothetical protein